MNVNALSLLSLLTYLKSEGRNEIFDVEFEAKGFLGNEFKLDQLIDLNFWLPIKSEYQPTASLTSFLHFPL